MSLGGGLPVHTLSLCPPMHWPLCSGELDAMTQARACGGATDLPRVLGEKGALEALEGLFPWGGVPSVPLGSSPGPTLGRGPH